MHTMSSLTDGLLYSQGLSNLRGKAGGGKDQGIVVPPADGRNTSYPFANLIPQDGVGKAFQRTPDEVLATMHMMQCMVLMSSWFQRHACVWCSVPQLQFMCQPLTVGQPGAHECASWLWIDLSLYICRCWQSCTEGTPHSRVPSTPKA